VKRAVASILLPFIAMAMLVTAAHIGYRKVHYWGHLRTATTIFEDDPGWNCATMGNKTCGTVP
jgi:hypothetical protein